ncbi:MAG: phosphoadenosine phosphosulfate reductase family protein [Deltaproteobacteria bacterium]|jgi:phosphoadenosine phosphosulfate reductase|nr:phosphoadenosine phosphosulfate reductase family protein [Deltaproteobacteria bacterium]
MRGGMNIPDFRIKPPSQCSVAEMTWEAIAFLQRHEPEEGYFLGFSGGKDSIVTYELCRMAHVRFQAVYSCTGIDAPELVRFIRQNYPDVEFCHPRRSFWQGIRRKSPPLRMMRWCCDLLKKDPVKKHTLFHNRILGLRAEESFKRAGKPRLEINGKRKIRKIFKPIFYWLEWQVWDFIEERGLAYPSLYDEGFDRLGCIVCPFIMHRNQTVLNRHKARWPQFYRAFEKVVAEWHGQRTRRNNARYAEETPEQYLAAYYCGFEKASSQGDA